MLDLSCELVTRGGGPLIVLRPDDLCALPSHTEKLVGREDLDPQLTCFIQLAPGVFSADQIVRPAAYRTARMGTQRFNFGVDLLPGVRLYLSSDNNGEAGKGSALAAVPGRRRLIGHNMDEPAQLRP